MTSWERWGAGGCLGIFCVALAAETVPTLHPPVSECLKWKDAGICRPLLREFTIPEHYSTEVGTPATGPTASIGATSAGTTHNYQPGKTVRL